MVARPTAPVDPAAGTIRPDAARSWAVHYPDRAASWQVPWGADVAAATCAREAIHTIEINYAIVEALEPAGQQATFDMLAAVGVRVASMHAPFSEPHALEQPDRAKRLAAVDRTARCLRTCSAQGVGRLVVHPCNRTCQDARTIVDNLRRSFDDLLPVAEAANVTLCLENMPSYHPFGSGPGDVPSILERYSHPRLRAVYDSGHANMAGAAAGIFDAMRPFIAHVHLHDNNGDRDLHLPPGYGTLPWPDLMPRLLRLQLDTPLFVEAQPWQSYTSFKRLQLETTALANACLGEGRFPTLRRPGAGDGWRAAARPGQRQLGGLRFGRERGVGAGARLQTPQAWHPRSAVTR